MAAEGIVRTWLLEEGWGVIDADDTPGGAWFHFSVLTPGAGVGLTVGRRVRFEWEPANQDGFSYRALSIAPIKV